VESLRRSPLFTARCPAAECQLSSEEGRRQLRSADLRTCVVRRTYVYGNFGNDVSRLPAQGCGTDNLPAVLRQTGIGYEQFKRLLKNFVWALRLEIAAHCALTILFKMRR